MKAAVEHIFTGPTGSLSGSYDSTKTLLASLIRQISGSTPDGNYISPAPSAMININESGAPNTAQIPHVVKWSDNIYYVFLASNLTGAAAFRTVLLFRFNAANSTIVYKGAISIAGNLTAGTKTIRSLRGFLYRHTTGTVSTAGSSSAITGSGTGFVSERIAAGARIGFGTTDATQVSEWHEILSITDDTNLTISANVNLPVSTSYVIEEIRIAAGISNATTVLHGGLYLLKGLHEGVFTAGAGTNINDATTVDNVRAAYNLRDAFPSGQPTASFQFTGQTGSLFSPNHGLTANDIVYFTTTTTLPTGIAANTLYYVTSLGLTNDRFGVQTTYGAATTASIITSGSGTHFIHMGTNIGTATLAADEFISNTEHYIYLVNATSVATTFASSVSKYNMRAALDVRSLLPGGPPSGSSSSAYVLRTQPLTHGTLPISLTNSGRIFTVNHGPAAGIKSLWFPNIGAGNRVYRASVSDLTNKSSNWLSAESMLEVPPGTSTTYSTLGTSTTTGFVQVDYSSTIDRLLITTNGGRLGVYVTPYVTDNTAFERIIGTNIQRLKQSTTDTDATNALFPQAALTIWTEDGWMFAVPASLTANLNWLFAFPFGVESTYHTTSNQYVITPKLATPNATKLYKLYIDHQEYSGTVGLGFPVESYRVWFRTSGIDDNSGAWTEIPIGTDLTSAAPGEYIQFRIAFDIMGELCIPTRIYSLALTYEDGSQDSHYEPSLTKSSAQNRQFAWRQIISWGGTIPNLRLRLFNVANDATSLDDTVTLSDHGTWEYSTDGTTWSAWSSSADTIGNYIRYTADDGIIGNAITVRALLTQA